MRPEILLALPASGPSSATTPVLETPHFAFHGDFETNLEDALEVAAAARHREAPEPFDSGPKAECFRRAPTS